MIKNAFGKYHLLLRKTPQFISLYNLEIARYFDNNTTVDFTDIEASLIWFHRTIIQCASNAFQLRYPNNTKNTFSKSWWTNELTHDKKH